MPFWHVLSQLQQNHLCHKFEFFCDAIPVATIMILEIVFISGVFTLANQQWPPIGFSLLWLCHCKSLTMFATDNFRSLPTMSSASGLICNLKKDFFTNSTTTTSSDVSHVASWLVACQTDGTATVNNIQVGTRFGVVRPLHQPMADGDLHWGLRVISPQALAERPMKSSQPSLHV